jgi:predicted NBD/HSP70 family sugar kinase
VAGADVSGMSAAASADSSKRVVIDTTVGRVEILFDEPTGIVSVYRFDLQGRPVAAALENWHFRDLAEVLERQTGIPETEAQEIHSALAEYWAIKAPRQPIEEVLVAEGREPRSGIFSFVLMGVATIALLVILWTTAQAFL